MTDQNKARQALIRAAVEGVKGSDRNDTGLRQRSQKPCRP